MPTSRAARSSTCPSARAPAARARGLLLALLAVAGEAAAAARAAAQERAGITGFTPAGASAQAAREATVLRVITPARLDSLSYALTREPRVAGSPGDARVRDWVLAQTRAWGLRSEAKAYNVFLPWATEVSLRLLAPDTLTFELGEEPLPNDPSSGLPQYPWVNGYSGTGEAEAQVVYVNYGLPEDYALLDSLRVDVRGRIVLARYGRSFRGIKEREAERRGAAALLLYADPAEDGYYRGDVYPDGPYRNPSAVQRGSVLNSDGDPTTPGWASVPGARRVAPGSREAPLPRLMVVPLSYGVAQEILGRLGPAELPRQDWQGALPFRYHVGPGPARVRLRVADDRAGPARGMKDIWDTFAWVPGSERPDEWVVVGAHRDAWGPGADDNGSGTAAVLAAARAVAELARAGQRPRRTIVFATWDAEEWALIGSVEWVEEMARQLSARAVGYINQDMVAGGTRFGASAAPALKAFVRELTHAVPSPEGGSVYEQWRLSSTPAEAAGGDVALGDLGGGSDFMWFYSNLGIPSAAWGFGGPSGTYHSAYDSYSFVSRFGDPGFVHHAAGAQLVALAALRLANAAVLPYDYAESTRQLRQVADRLHDRALAAGAGMSAQALAALVQAFGRMEAAADSLAGARDDFLRAGGAPAARADDANRHLMQVERSMIRPAGLPGRPSLRNLTVAVDEANGYADLMLPGVAEALRASDFTRATAEAHELVGRVNAATDQLRQATRALSRR